MQQSYTSKYFKIYFWQALSIIFNLVSLFIVTPKLTAQPLIYGTYMVCVSATIFLSYADLGFLSACYKYASESLALNNIDKEIKLTAFGAFILFIFICLISLGFLFLSFYPQYLIKDIKDISEISIASRLLLILSIFSVNNVCQRIIQLIFGIRLDDFIFQRINIIASAIKISSVFYFFRGTNYNIVGYFLFSQIVGLLVSYIGIYIVRRKYKYDFILFIKNFHFSKEIYNYTKLIAYSTLYITIMWILYYELDTFVIAKFLGASNVAYFAIGFSLLTVFRTIFGMLYNPFSARFNHFVGSNDNEGLKQFFINVIAITLPIVLFPIVASAILMKPFIFSWVGNKFALSVPIATFLVLTYLFSYISYPAGIILIAFEQIKKMYIVNTVIAVIYWIGIICTVQYFGVISFGLFKFFAFITAGIFYIFYSSNILKVNKLTFIKQIFIPIIIPISFILTLFLIKPYLPLEKDKFNLLIVIILIGIYTIIASIIYFFVCSIFREYVKNIYNKVFKKIIL